jgi:2-keto-4-pentenoate hydratase/2-oxohepta-3-ene-1,7-dioic acid hydratase in catechol pathway
MAPIVIDINKNVYIIGEMQQVSFVTYRLPSSPEWQYALRSESRLADFTDLGFNGTTRDLLRLGADRIEPLLGRAAQTPEAWQEIDRFNGITFGPPVPDPDKVLCIGLNYREHAREAGLPIPPVPVVFAKFRNSLIGSGAPIQLPEVSRQIDYEGELAVVIGQRCKRVSTEEALRVIGGYSVLNDISARDLQMQVSQWTIGKAIDTFAPMGPGLVPARRIPDPQKLELVTRLNGQIVQQSSTADMIFSVAEIIAHLTQVMTLEPGDIIATGTPAGVGFTRDPALFLQPGDIVEVEIPSVGRLVNPVIKNA